MAKQTRGSYLSHLIKVKPHKPSAPSVQASYPTLYLDSRDLPGLDKLDGKPGDKLRLLIDAYLASITLEDGGKRKSMRFDIRGIKKFVRGG